MTENIGDHRAFVASLSTDQRQSLTEKSNRNGLTHLAIHVGAIAIVGTLIVLRVPFWPALLVVQGVALIFLFTLLHETIHRTAFATQMLNDGVATVCGFLILIPANWFRYFHFAHHRHTQDPEMDPELATPKPQTARQYIAHISGVPVWIGLIKTIFINAAGKCRDDYVPKSARSRIQQEAIGMLALYGLVLAASVMAGSSLLLWVWIVPILLGQPFLRAYLLAEHGLCPLVSNMLQNTRTTYTNKLICRLAWNMPYHTEHHVYPTVPFHNLPKLNGLMKENLLITSQGYVEFNQEYIEALEG